MRIHRSLGRLSDFAQVLVLGERSSKFHDLVYALKYHWRQSREDTLLESVDAFLRRFSSIEVDAVVSVPPNDRSRRVQPVPRVASKVAELMAAAFLPEALTVVRDVPDFKQVEPIRRARLLRRAYRLREGLSVRELRVLVVDDFILTGCTLREVGRTLKAAGAVPYALVLSEAREFGRPCQRKEFQ